VRERWLTLRTRTWDPVSHAWPRRSLTRSAGLPHAPAKNGAWPHSRAIAPQMTSCCAGSAAQDLLPQSCGAQSQSAFPGHGSSTHEAVHTDASQDCNTQICTVAHRVPDAQGSTGGAGAAGPHPALARMPRAKMSTQVATIRTIRVG
jgi:hypothetical protein